MKVISALGSIKHAIIINTICVPDINCGENDGVSNAESLFGAPVKGELSQRYGMFELLGGS